MSALSQISRNFIFNFFRNGKSHSILKIVIAAILLFLYIGSYDLKAQESDLSSQAWQLVKEEKTNDAIALVTKSIELFPRDYKNYLLRAEICHMVGQNTSAIADCKYYVENLPADMYVYLLMGDIEMALGNFTNAITYYQHALRLSDISVNKQYCHLKIGEAYNLQKNYQLAFTELKEAEFMFSTDTTYLYNMAVSTYYLNQVDQSLKYLQKITDNYTDFPKAYDLLSIIYKNQGKYVMAKDALQKKMKLVTPIYDDYDLLYKLSILTNEPAVAEWALENKVNLRPDNIDDILYLAGIYQKKQDYTKAVWYVNIAIKLKPEMFENYKLIGDLYYELKNTDKACDCYFIAMSKGYYAKYGEEILNRYIEVCEKK